MRRAVGVLLDVARHVVPLIQFYEFQGSLERYALLTAFDLALGLVVIVATTRETSDVTAVDARSREVGWQALAVAILAVFFAGVAAFLTIPIGMAAFIASTGPDSDWWGLLWSPGLWQQVALMSMLASVRAHALFVQRTTVGAAGPANRSAPVVGDLAGDRRRSLADYAAQVTLVATFTGLCYLLATVGGRVMSLLPALFALMLAFYDARPDIGRQLFPALWRESKADVAAELKSRERRPRRR